MHYPFVVDLPTRAEFEASIPWHHCTSNVWHQRRGNDHISQCYRIYYTAAGERIGTFYRDPIVERYDARSSGVMKRDEIREFTTCSTFYNK